MEPRPAAESHQESGLVVVLNYNVIPEFDLLMLLRAPAFLQRRASVYRHTSKLKYTPRWRQKNAPNSEYILVVRRDQRFQSSGPGTYPRASRKAPPATFADVATPSSRRHVDGVEDDLMIQHERAVKF